MEEQNWPLIAFHVWQSHWIPLEVDGSQMLVLDVIHTLGWRTKMKIYTDRKSCKGWFCGIVWTARVKLHYTSWECVRHVQRLNPFNPHWSPLVKTYMCVCMKGNHHRWSKAFYSLKKGWSSKPGYWGIKTNSRFVPQLHELICHSFPLSVSLYVSPPVIEWSRCVCTRVCIRGSFIPQLFHARLSSKGAGPHFNPGLSGVVPRTRWGTIVLHHASIIHREPEKVAKCVCLLNN